MELALRRKNRFWTFAMSLKSRAATAKPSASTAKTLRERRHRKNQQKQGGRSQL